MSPATAEEGGYRFIGSAPHKMKLHRINVKYLVILEKIPIYLQLHPLSFLTECPLLVSTKGPQEKLDKAKMLLGNQL